MLMRWELVPGLELYGDPLDVDQDYVRNAAGEVRWVEDSFNMVFRWRPGDQPGAPLVESTADEWMEWAGGSLDLVRPAQ